MDKENKDIPMPEIAKREENFFNGALPSTVEGKIHYTELQRIANNIDGLQRTKAKEDILRVIFSRVYDFIISHNKTTRRADYSIFDSTTGLYNDVFESCFFISLCMYLHDTKRIKGSSLRKFIYDHSPMGYGVEGSQNYFDYSRPKHFIEISDNKIVGSDRGITSAENKLRQYRTRLRANRPVKIRDVEWSAIRRTSEHEWELYFALDQADKVIQDTAKGMRLLYDGVDAALKAPMDEGYAAKLETAYKKFESKLKKIQYEHFLDLGKFYLEHINKDKTCYGINLYRFEKQFRLYGITSGVNRLLECQSEDEIYRFLKTQIIVNNVPFPKLCKHFSGVENSLNTMLCVDAFLSFMNDIVRSSRLVIDEFVEKGFFGEDWNDLFLKLTNDMVEDVLYDPAQINYSISDDSQEMFSLYLEAPVYANVNRAVQNFNYVKPLLFPDEDKEDTKDARNTRTTEDAETTGEVEAIGDAKTEENAAAAEDTDN